MFSIYDRATRLALNLVGPYGHGDGARPTNRVWPCLRAHLYPLRWVIAFSLIITALLASIEVWLISYAGRLIDMLVDSCRSVIWKDHSASLIFACIMTTCLETLVFCDVPGAAIGRYRWNRRGEQNGG